MVISGQKCPVSSGPLPGRAGGWAEGEASLWMPPGPEIRPMWWAGEGSPDASPHLSGTPVFLEFRAPASGPSTLPARGWSSHAGPLGSSVPPPISLCQTCSRCWSASSAVPPWRGEGRTPPLMGWVLCRLQLRAGALWHLLTDMNGTWAGPGQESSKDGFTLQRWRPRRRWLLGTRVLSSQFGTRLREGHTPDAQAKQWSGWLG